MHKIRIKNYDHPEKDSLLVGRHYYRVHLGNSCVKYFSSKRQAEYFLSDLSDFLNQCMYDINVLLADIYQLYRRSWPYFSGGNKVTRDGQRDNIRKEISGIEDSLNRMPRRAAHPSGAFNIFPMFNSCIGSMRAVLSTLTDLHKGRSNFVELTEISGYCRRIDHLEHEISTFGFEQEEVNTPPVMGKPSPNGGS